MRRQVVKGRGCQTNNKSAIPQLRVNKESTKIIWKVLFDSKHTLTFMIDIIHSSGNTRNGIFETNILAMCY